MAEALVPLNVSLHHKQVTEAPVIRHCPLGNVLTLEQEKWIGSKAFDFKTENPLVQRQISDKEAASSRYLEKKRQAVVEVQSLQDSIEVGSGSSDVAAKLNKQRKERHDSAWSNMKEELAAVSLEVEGRIEEVANSLKNSIKETDRVLAVALEETRCKLPLHLLVRQDLVDLWEGTLCQQLQERAALIQDASRQLERIEQDRVAKVEAILGQWSPVLHSISFLLPEDLKSLVHREAQAINGAVVANKLSNAELILTLMTGNADKSRAVHRQWEELVGVWQEACCSYVEDCFRRFIEEQSVKWREEMDHLKECWATELRSLNSRWLQHWEQLKSHVPPRVSKPQCYEWQQTHTRLTREVAQVQDSHLARLQGLHERISSLSLEQGDRWKGELVTSGACDREAAHQFALDHLIPLVEHKQKELVRELHVYEEYCGAALELQTSKAQELFQFVLGAVHLWDTHLLDLQGEECKMDEGLKQCRRIHDQGNQKEETELDLLLDQLRQGPNEEVLRTLLQESLTRLDHVRDSYHAFQQRMLSELAKYPVAVASTISNYDLKLCKYFQVERKPPKKQKKLSQSRKVSQASSRASMRDAQLSDLTQALEETVVTSSGTVFYICKQSTLGSGESPGVFLTQTAGEGPAPAAAFLVEAMAIPEDAWDSVYKGMRSEFLEQLEQWRLSSVEKAERTVAEKTEELSIELDLRLHLHEGRPARVEQDIHHVRATELLAHRDRVSRHIQGVRGELTTLKGLVEELEGKHKTMLEAFGSEMNNLQKAMELAQRMSGLLSVQEQFKAVYQKHLSDGEACAVQFTERVEDSCAGLSQSTQQFRESLKTFSEGGNYSPEEVDTFCQKMDRLTSRVASTQTSLLKDLQALRESYAEGSEKLMTQFEYKWSQYRMDLTLVEKITKVLQSTQIRIKSEVAASNTQYQVIKERVGELPNKVASSADGTEVVCVALREVFRMVGERVEYLHCSVHHQGARVGVVEGELVTPLSSITATQAILNLVSSTPQGRNHQPPRTSLQTAATSNKPLTSEAASRKPKQTERKHVTFGFGGGKDGSECFLPKIRQVLKEAHIELYTSAEGYYRQKGARSVTQAHLLEGTFDACIDKTITHLQSYRQQAEEYRNNCIDELHGLLHQLSEVVKEVPETCLTRVFVESEAECAAAREGLQQQHVEKMEALAKEHAAHVSQLRPALGHPSKESQLTALDHKERERYKQVLQLLSAHAAAHQEVEELHAKRFTEKVLRSVSELVGALDGVTLNADIIPPCGSKSRVKSDLEQLLRSHTSGDRHCTDPAKPSSHGGRKWSGLQSLELACGDKALSLKMKGTVNSKKQSVFHEKVFEIRDRLCRDYLSNLRSREEAAKERGSMAEGEEESKLKKWQSSLDNVKKLYVV